MVFGRGKCPGNANKRRGQCKVRVEVQGHGLELCITYLLASLPKCEVDNILDKFRSATGKTDRRMYRTYGLTLFGEG